MKFRISLVCLGLLLAACGNSILGNGSMADSPVFSAPSGSYAVGFQFTLTSDQTDATISYQISKDGAAGTWTNYSGAVTLSALGTYVVKAKASVSELDDSDTVTRTYTIVSGTALRLNQTAMILIPGQTGTALEAYAPTATSRSRLPLPTPLEATWESSNAAVATVTPAGVVTAVSVGVAQITASYGTYASSSCTVAVKSMVAAGRDNTSGTYNAAYWINGVHHSFDLSSIAPGSSEVEFLYQTTDGDNTYLLGSYYETATSSNKYFVYDIHDAGTTLIQNPTQGTIGSLHDISVSGGKAYVAGDVFFVSDGQYHPFLGNIDLNTGEDSGEVLDSALIETSSGLGSGQVLSASISAIYYDGSRVAAAVAFDDASIQYAGVWTWEGAEHTFTSLGQDAITRDVAMDAGNVYLLGVKKLADSTTWECGCWKNGVFSAFPLPSDATNGASPIQFYVSGGEVYASGYYRGNLSTISTLLYWTQINGVMTVSTVTNTGDIPYSTSIFGFGGHVLQVGASYSDSDYYIGAWIDGEAVPLIWDTVPYNGVWITPFPYPT